MAHASLHDMHLDGLPKKLAAYLQSDPALRPLAEAVERHLTLVSTVLQRSDPFETGLWFDTFVKQHPALNSLSSDELRKQFMDASWNSKPVFDAVEVRAPGVIAQAEQVGVDDFRPSYFTAVKTIVSHEKSRLISAVMRELTESDREVVFRDLAQEFRKPFNKADEVKPESLERFEGVQRVTQELTELMTEVVGTRIRFGELMNEYGSSVPVRSPAAYHAEVLEPQLFAWADQLQTALGKFKQVESWQSSDGTATQRLALGELWLKFTELRADWMLKRSAEGKIVLLETLMAGGPRLLPKPGDATFGN